MGLTFFKKDSTADTLKSSDKENYVPTTIQSTKVKSKDLINSPVELDINLAEKRTRNNSSRDKVDVKQPLTGHHGPDRKMSF
jgi:hypothetical protein